MQLTDGKYVLVPLYHGTSMMFFEEIRRFGLGGAYPDIVSKSRRLLRDLANLEGLSWLEDPELCVLKPDIDNMIEQTVTRGGFNYRYGNAYVTACRAKAISHATSHQFGSELLSTTMKVLERLHKQDPARSRAMAARHQIDPRLRVSEHRPLLLEASHVPVRNLNSECGEDPMTLLDLIQGYVDRNPNLFSRFFGQLLNFELISPMPGDGLRYYEIRSDSASLGQRKYELKEIE